MNLLLGILFALLYLVEMLVNPLGATIAIWVFWNFAYSQKYTWYVTESLYSVLRWFIHLFYLFFSQQGQILNSSVN